MAIANYNIASSSFEELLEVVIDSEVTFAKHIENLCRKTNQRLHALTRVTNFMTLEKCSLVMKTFVFSQFDYCLIVWTCHSGKEFIDYKKELNAFYTIIRAQLFISCSIKTNQ